MANLKELYQDADWRSEKHAPAIEAPSKVKGQEPVRVTVTVGKEIPHPNTTEHHIRWIEVYFHPKGEKFPYQIGRFEFGAHGESAQGPNTSSVFSQPSVTCIFRTEKPGTIHASSYCNIHGLWESSLELDVSAA